MKKKYLFIMVVIVSMTILIACDSFQEGFEDGMEGSNTEYSIEIEVDFQEHISGGTHMVVAGNTDLPDGEEVIISVTSEENDYIATSEDTVTDGIYFSEPFSKQGESLQAGEYKITVKTSKGDKASQEKVIIID